MDSPLQEIERRTARAIREALGMEADPVVTPSLNPQFGDYQSNAAMQIAGRLKAQGGEKTNPRQVAEQILTKLDERDLLAHKPSVAGPGFINFALSPRYVAAQCTEALRDERLGIAKVERPQRVVVEYSSPNIAKQMHVGHIRSTILGDCAARLLEFLGHDVIRQNHIGDWGTQFGMLIAHFLEKGGDAYRISDLEGFYKGAKRRFDSEPEFANRARSYVVALQSGDVPTRTAWHAMVKQSRSHFRELYERLNTTLADGAIERRQENRFGMAFEHGESRYNNRLPSLADELLSQAVVQESEGAVVSFAGGFKAPLIIRKSDGGFGYGTTDLAAVEFRARCDRIEAYGRDGLCADRVIYFVDARQSQHFKQVFATALAAAEKLENWRRVKDVSLEHASFGSVLGEDGTPIKTREGENVKLADLLDEAERRARSVVDEQSAELPEDEKAALAKAVGIGAVKYADLSKDRTSDYVFSYDQMLSLDGNTAPYLQYAHARIRSIQGKAAEQGIASSDAIRLLAEPAELALAKHVLTFGDVVRTVARELRPHLLCIFLYETARRFSVFYENCPVLRSEGEVRASRLALTEVTGRTLRLGLDLLGIAHPDRM